MSPGRNYQRRLDRADAVCISFEARSRDPSGGANTCVTDAVERRFGIYPDFFWKMVRPYIGDALRYLRVTQEGQQWISNLYANVFSMEHRNQLSR
jgi:hypothetical protein